MDFLRQMYDASRARQFDEVADGNYPLRTFKGALRGMAVIAEVKYATPAEGELGIAEPPAELAKIYEAMGAKAISCLTEPAYFKGDMDYIRQIREASGLPVLMKDFISSRRQIRLGRNLGADAFLLICEMLSLDELQDLYDFGRSLGMDGLVEIHGQEGLEKAVAIGAEIIGVNVRDLATLRVHPERHAEMISLLPAGSVRVAESGISSGERLQELKELGYDAALIGRGVVNGATREAILCG